MKNTDFMAELPYGEIGIWGGLFKLAAEIDKLKEPTYGPMIDDTEVES